MNPVVEQLKERTIKFALVVVQLCRSLPSTWEGRHVADQLFRSATSVAANYHAACRARSRRDFIAKLGIVLEEAEETTFWLRFAGRSGLKEASQLEPALAESRELLAIFVASAKTAAANNAANRR